MQRHCRQAASAAVRLRLQRAQRINSSSSSSSGAGGRCGKRGAAAIDSFRTTESAAEFAEAGGLCRRLLHRASPPAGDRAVIGSERASVNERVVACALVHGEGLGGERACTGACGPHGRVGRQRSLEMSGWPFQEAAINLGGARVGLPCSGLGNAAGDTARCFSTAGERRDGTHEGDGRHDTHEGEGGGREQEEVQPSAQLKNRLLPLDYSPLSDTRQGTLEAATFLHPEWLGHVARLTLLRARQLFPPPPPPPTEGAAANATTAEAAAVAATTAAKGEGRFASGEAGSESSPSSAAHAGSDGRAHGHERGEDEVKHPHVVSCSSSSGGGGSGSDTDSSRASESGGGDGGIAAGSKRERGEMVRVVTAPTLDYGALSPATHMHDWLASWKVRFWVWAVYNRFLDRGFQLDQFLECAKGAIEQAHQWNQRTIVEAFGAHLQKQVQHDVKGLAAYGFQLGFTTGDFKSSDTTAHSNSSSSSSSSSSSAGDSGRHDCNDSTAPSTEGLPWVSVHECVPIAITMVTERPHDGPLLKSWGALGPFVQQLLQQRMLPGQREDTAILMDNQAMEALSLPVESMDCPDMEASVFVHQNPQAANVESGSSNANGGVGRSILGLRELSLPTAFDGEEYRDDMFVCVTARVHATRSFLFCSGSKEPPSLHAKPTSDTVEAVIVEDESASSSYGIEGSSAADAAIDRVAEGGGRRSYRGSTAAETTQMVGALAHASVAGVEEERVMELGSQRDVLPLAVRLDVRGYHYVRFARQVPKPMMHVLRVFAGKDEIEEWESPWHLVSFSTVVGESMEVRT